MILTAALLGLSGFFFAGVGAIHVSERKALQARRDQQVAEYIRTITDENELLRNSNAETRQHLRDNLFRELGWLEERKRLNNRLKIAFQELACDDSKKTRVMRRPT